MKAIIVAASFHHQNTEKIARLFADMFDATVQKPEETDPRDLLDFDLVGFGSGIYSERHHPSLLDLIDRLLPSSGAKAFIFSTSGAPWGFPAFHTPLREKLQARGYAIVDEFNCVGLNTNSFLKVFGGMNKGRPNADDRLKAEAFALKLKESFPDR